MGLKWLLSLEAEMARSVSKSNYNSPENPSSGYSGPCYKTARLTTRPGHSISDQPRQVAFIFFNSTQILPINPCVNTVTASIISRAVVN